MSIFRPSRAIRIAIAILPTVLVLGCSTLDATKSNAIRLESKTNVVDGLQRVISVPRKSVFGQPVPLRIVFTNKGSEPISLEELRGGYPMSQIGVYDSKGKHVKVTDFGAAIMIPWSDNIKSGSIVKLEQGASHAYEIDLHKACELGAGICTVKIHYMVLPIEFPPEGLVFEVIGGSAPKCTRSGR